MAHTSVDMFGELTEGKKRIGAKQKKYILVLPTQ